MDIIDRHTLGHIVYSRKRWALKPQTLLSHLAGRGEVEAFAVINEWRSARNIPERLFVKEPVVAQGSFYRYKPQYIDFSSPTFVQIFRSMLRPGTKALVLEETLPDPRQLPEIGGHWMIEVQLESLGPHVPSPPVPCEGNQQERSSA